MLHFAEPDIGENQRMTHATTATNAKNEVNAADSAYIASTASTANIANAVPKIGFVSLGCPKALTDSELILTQLRAE